MKIHAKRAIGRGCFLGLLTLIPVPLVHAEYVVDPVVESVVRGDQRHAFPAGYIRQNQPFEGIVNQVTGDNQVTGNRMISGGTHAFYLRMNSPQDVTVGTLYTVYRRAHKVYHPVTRQYLGELIHQLGVVRVTQVDGRLASGKLVASFNSIGPGDHLMRFTPPESDSATPQPTAQAAADAQGIVIDFMANRTLLGQHHIVYLDRGRNDGLRPGDTLQLYRTGGGLPRRVLGEVRVVAAEEETSTALVTKAIAPILIGDRVVMKPASTDQAAAEAESLPLTEKEQVRQLARRIDDLAKESNGKSSIRVDETGPQVVLSLDELVDHLYFESGEAALKAEGHSLLKQIGDILKEMPDKQIRVEGHTDNQEIGPTLKNKFPSNWELSKARAAGVARYLIHDAGLDPDRVSSVGYGATKPVAPNTTDAGRQKNRRVEIVFQAAGSSKVPTPKAPAFTEQSLPAPSSATTLSTVATPSLSESVTGSSTNLDAPESSPVPAPAGEMPGMEAGAAQDFPEVTGPGASGSPSQTDAPTPDGMPLDGKTSALPSSPDAPVDRGSF